MNVLDQLFRDTNVGSESGKFDPASIDYCAELCEAGASRIALEPDRLANEKRHIAEETENLAFSHYKTFIDAATCSKDLRSDFGAIDKSLDKLLTDAPDLSSLCRQFIVRAQETAHARHSISVTLAKHTNLLEVLEMPQVMDTCVKGGYYEEALELAQYTNKLERRLSHIPLIKTISSDVRSQRQYLAHHMLEQLRMSLSLPQALKVVALLRRLDIMNETELRLAFLKRRNAWFEKQLESVSATEVYQRLSRIIELSRTHLFDIVTQYRAVFADDDPLAHSLAGRSADDAQNGRLVFHSWLMYRINIFVATVKKALSDPSVVSTDVLDRLDSIVSQCMYFGASLGRIGADFRGLLVPVFEDVILMHWRMGFEQAKLSFIETVNSAKKIEISMDSESTFKPFLPNTGGNTSLTPPVELMTCHALSQFTNAALIEGVNRLRLCAPLTIAEPCMESCRDALKEVCTCVVALKLTQGNETQVEAFGALLIDHVIPYANRLLEALFPRAAVLQHVGVSVSAAERVEKIEQKIRLQPNAFREIFGVPEPSKAPQFVIPAAVTSAVEEAATAEGDVSDVPEAVNDVAVAVESEKNKERKDDDRPKSPYDDDNETF